MVTHVLLVLRLIHYSNQSINKILKLKLTYLYDLMVKIYYLIIYILNNKNEKKIH